MYGQELGWLEALSGTLRCANCGNVYSREDVSVVGNKDDFWFVRCTCHSCSNQGIGVVIVKELTSTTVVIDEEERIAPGRSFEVDDVLLAHELLRDYAGDMHGLFEGIPGR